MTKYLVVAMLICVGATGANCNQYQFRNETTPNNVIFEKFEYKVFNKTWLKDAVVKWKMIAYNVGVFNASVTLTEPINEFWLHYVTYYKWRVYQKYLIDVWLDICDVLKAPNKHPLSEMIYQNFQNVREGVYVNIDDIKCPFSGNITVKSLQGLNASYLVFPLMQAGRYRIDVSFSTKINGPIFAMVQVYGSISDFRVWF